jgi:hypothetical protein
MEAKQLCCLFQMDGDIAWDTHERDETSPIVLEQALGLLWYVQIS